MTPIRTADSKVRLSKKKGFFSRVMVVTIQVVRYQSFIGVVVVSAGALFRSGSGHRFVDAESIYGQ